MAIQTLYLQLNKGKNEPISPFIRHRGPINAADSHPSSQRSSHATNQKHTGIPRQMESDHRRPDDITIPRPVSCILAFSSKTIICIGNLEIRNESPPVIRSPCMLIIVHNNHKNNHMHLLRARYDISCSIEGINLARRPYNLLHRHPQAQYMHSSVYLIRGMTHKFIIDTFNSNRNCLLGY